MYTTTKIANVSSGGERSFGSAFFYTVELNDGQQAPLLVTNKHVVAGADTVRMVAHTRDASHWKPSGHFSKYEIHLDMLIEHPDNNIDLCAIPVAGMVDHAETSGRPVFFTAVNRSMVPSQDEWEDFDATESISMIGCPNGLFDEHNGLPVTRRGVTATPPRVNYKGKPEFLVDVACFPGSSGSPVFLSDATGHRDRVNNAISFTSARYRILGVLYAGPTITTEGQIVFSVKPSFQMNGMMHLGQVIKSTELLAFDDIVAHKFAARSE